MEYTKLITTVYFQNPYICPYIIIHSILKCIVCVTERTLLNILLVPREKSSPWRWRQHGPPKRWYPTTSHSRRPRLQSSSPCSLQWSEDRWSDPLWIVAFELVFESRSVLTLVTEITHHSLQTYSEIILKEWQGCYSPSLFIFPIHTDPPSCFHSTAWNSKTIQDSALTGIQNQ